MCSLRGANARNLSVQCLFNEITFESPSREFYLCDLTPETKKAAFFVKSCDCVYAWNICRFREFHKFVVKSRKDNERN